MFKHVALGVLLAFLWVALPFRLLVLGAETFLVHPGNAHFSQSDARYWQALELEARLLALGWRVTYARHLTLGGEEAYGVTMPDNHAVVIEERLHWSARAAVLAHEAGHTVQPSWVSHTEGECFAEAVATLVVRDGIRDHARYLATARWTCLGMLLAEFPAIYHAAALLTD